MEYIALDIVAHILKALYDRAYTIYYSVFIQPKLSRLLTRYNRYYSLLEKDKKMYERKVWDFIRYNKFVARENLKITLSLKTLIASHAMQLAHYLPDEAYDYYERIILYKEYYLSRFTQKYHKAEVNPSFRVIVFSVRAIHESISNPGDGINVMIHEFAHALWLEHKLMNQSYRIFNDQLFAETEFYLNAELARSKDDDQHFFRKYAFTSSAEFFAVAVENFFERPRLFHRTLPELYSNFTRLFLQDPLHLK